MRTNDVLTRANTQPVQLRHADDDQPGKLSGYGAVFYRADDPGTQFILWGDGKSEGSAVERIMPGAFDDMADDVRCMFNHDPDQLLGRTKSGTLRLSIDERGLNYECDINPDDPDHQRVGAKIARGDVDGSSFWFRILDEQNRTEDGVQVYEITKVRVIEVGPVVMPAYESTTTDVRSAHINQRKQQLAAVQAKIDHDQMELDAVCLGIPKAK